MGFVGRGCTRGERRRDYGATSSEECFERGLVELFELVGYGALTVHLSRIYGGCLVRISCVSGCSLQGQGGTWLCISFGRTARLATPHKHLKSCCFT